MSSLIVALPVTLPQAASQLAYVQSVDGKSVSQQSTAAPGLLPGLNMVDRVAVVPAAAMSWHLLQLPRGALGRRAWSDSQSPRLRAILEGLLEEQLLDEPVQLHFALAPQARDDGPVWVAVCDRAWLRSWLAVLEQHQCPVTRIVPEFAPTEGAGATDALYVTGSPGQAQVVWSASGRQSVLPLTSATAALLDWPATSPIIAEPSVAATAETLFQRPVDLQHSAERWLLASQGEWDLAQFDLANPGRARRWRRWGRWAADGLRAPRWRAARWALVSLVAVQLAGLNAWAWAERNSLAARQLAVRQVLTQTFPGVKTVIDAPVQMERELALLRRQAGGMAPSDFEPLMVAFSSVITSLSLVNSAQSAIEYVANELRIKGFPVSPAQVEEASRMLRPQGFTLRSDGGVLVIQAGTAP